MALPQHHPRLLLLAIVLSLIAVQPVHGRTSPISDLKSKISGVEELLEEFRKQLQQEQAYKMGSVTDSCVGDFNAARQSIIQAKASIEQGATFFLVPNRVYTWRDCLHACCSQPHCTVAVVQEDLSQPGDSRCSNYQFKCDDGCCIDITYACDGKQHCPDRSDEDFCSNWLSSPHWCFNYWCYLGLVYFSSSLTHSLSVKCLNAW
uniref:Seven cysteines N-terminal domain-containing protein n=1 Tax=Mola mola TaxID=94237 RepID=A0A3Q3X4S5_MOLML